MEAEARKKAFFTKRDKGGHDAKNGSGLEKRLYLVSREKKPKKDHLKIVSNQ